MAIIQITSAVDRVQSVKEMPTIGTSVDTMMKQAIGNRSVVDPAMSITLNFTASIAQATNTTEMKTTTIATIATRNVIGQTSSMNEALLVQPPTVRRSAPSTNIDRPRNSSTETATAQHMTNISDHLTIAQVMVE